jgi:NADH-quinone oxidoreductase subunit H
LLIAAVLVVGAGVLFLLNLKAPGLLTGAVVAAMGDPGQAPLILKAGLLHYLETAWSCAPWMLELTSIFIVIGTLLSVFGVIFALTSLVERKMLARIQNRFGPNRAGPWGLFQPLADAIKMLTKEDIVPTGADKVLHLLAPITMLVPALLVLAILPYGPGMVPVELGVGILFFFALGATTEVGVFMAGWGSNNKYSLLGAMRSIAQMISYEIPLFLAALAVVMLSGSLSPDAIVSAQDGYVFSFVPHWFVFTPWGFAGFLLFFTAALAESNRSPFDLPEGESELVAGHMTEYSGFKYAVFFMAEYIGLFAICGFAVTLFLGGWHAPLPWLEWIPGYLWFFIKLYALVLLAIWVRGTVPRMRGDHLMGFAWKFMIPMGFAVILAAAVWHYAGGGVPGWLASAVIVLMPYLALGRVVAIQYPASRRVYRFSES